MTKNTPNKEVSFYHAGRIFMRKYSHTCLVNRSASKKKKKLIPTIPTKHTSEVEFPETWSFALCQAGEKSLELQKSPGLSARWHQCYSVLPVTLCLVSGWVSVSWRSASRFKYSFRPYGATLFVFIRKGKESVLYYISNKRGCSMALDAGAPSALLSRAMALNKWINEWINEWMTFVIEKNPSRLKFR